MIRHIPNKYSTTSLLEEINIEFKGKFDFFYLPMDYDNQCNLGYAFVNFVDPLHVLQFYSQYKSRKWKKYKSHKECDLSYAKFQGKTELTCHLEKSCLMNKMTEEKKNLSFLHLLILYQKLKSHLFLKSYLKKFILICSTM